MGELKRLVVPAEVVLDAAGAFPPFLRGEMQPQVCRKPGGEPDQAPGNSTAGVSR